MFDRDSSDEKGGKEAPPFSSPSSFSPPSLTSNEWGREGRRRRRRAPAYFRVDHNAFPEEEEEKKRKECEACQGWTCTKYKREM